jgi:bacteriocin biosynthesis cyclodehydratase domain-containing protein
VRPVLTPAVLPLWRDASTLQLGRGSGRSAVISGVDPALRSTLQRLDGAHDCDELVRAAVTAGCPAERSRALLDLLDHTGLLDDAGQERSALAGLGPPERARLAPDLASLALLRGDGGLPALALRRAVRVRVLGAGRVGVPLALTLAAAGVGTVDVDDDGLTRAEDTGVGGLDLGATGRRRGEAARELVRRTAPSAGGSCERPDLVVLATGESETRELARGLVLDGTPHLLAQVRDTTGVVGPLVLPGRTPCVRCLELTRCDLDPAWPALAAQLSSSSARQAACDGPLALAVAAQGAMQVLAMVDATTEPAALGGTLEMALPDWRWRRRSWPPHPDCGCTLAP